MRRGQVSIEATMAAVIMLIALVLILSQSSQRTQQLEYLNTAGVQAKECLALQSAISAVLSARDNAEIRVDVLHDVNFTKNTIDFPDNFCHFSGNQIEAELSGGIIKIRKVDGVVSAENV